MANQQTIGVNLKFSADVSAAKKSMAELQSSLSQIYKATATSVNPGVKFAKDLNSASQAAAQLRIQLQNAFNQDTGKLNLTKFNMEMKQSGMSLQKYKTELASIGPQGEKAFAQLAHNIATAEANTISLSNGLQRLGATFMNTLRYQLSSSVLMALTSGISEAVNYVKDLNASLNDIRIVTSYGAEEMEKFAAQATKAAKALSTTTNEYAKASLIYFQQGLTDEEVQKRTDLTIKMANVTGESVSKVSDQLTAVWNNFDNGTQSLEHYVDVMVALGAATASSTDEISEGLNKFAAIAETVGLSYEYAASALATVTATTRQSADIVGTAFKTLFARIQDLELGKELDDGTTLGQYSQALATIGIDIKDVNGEIKDMNVILDEMGAKWNTLSKDSQIALAQNVAGVRQYTQLIALMDNYDYFKQNLETANASTGALQEQADIYAESWEAAAERVSASLESIYNKLLDDDFFIDATNLLADFIGLVEKLIDGLGGVPGVLGVIGVALTKIFSSQMAAGVNNVVTSIRSLTPSGKKEIMGLQETASQESRTGYGTTGAGGQQSLLSNRQSDLQIQFLKNKDKMTEVERQTAEVRLNELKNQKDLINLQLEKNKAAERQLSAEKKINLELTQQEKLKKKFGWGEEAIKAAENNKYLQGASVFDARNNTQYYGITEDSYKTAVADLERSSAAKNINEAALGFTNESTFSALTNKSDISNTEAKIKAIDELQSRLKGLGITADKVEDQMADIVGPELSKKYQGFAKSLDKIKEKIANLDPNDTNYDTKIANLVKHLQDVEGRLEAETNAMQENSRQALRVSGSTQEFTDKLEASGTAAGEAQGDLMRYGQAAEGLGKNIDKSRLRVLDFGEAITQAAGLISSMTMVISSLVGLFQTLADPELDPSEKITTVLTTLGFMLPMIVSTITSLNGSLGLTLVASLSAAGGVTVANTKIKELGFDAFKTNIVLKGLFITLAKFAIYAAAIGIVVGAVVTLAKAADNARNSAANFAASAAQGAKDAAEAYNEATSAFNELKNSIASYEDALNGLQKLTQGTNEYKQALFDANEQALALVQNHAGLKYYIDSNGLIVFEEGELDRIEAEAQQKKTEAYSSKLSTDRAAREASIENQKVQLGRQLKGRDTEWNNEDTAAARTGAAIGAGAAGTVGGFAGGALIGAKLGQLGWAAGPVGALIGTVAGVVIGGAVGAIAGSMVSGFDNDATKQEQKALDALYEAYKEQGDAALTEEGIRKALHNVGIDDAALIDSLAENESATKELMKAMEANTAAIEAETLSVATQQAHALDATLKYRESEAQAAITRAMARVRTTAGKSNEKDPNSYRDAGLFNWWYSANQTGTTAFNAWAQANGLSNKNVKATNFSDNYIEYEYIDDEGNTQQKKLQYSQLAAWEQAQAVDALAKSAYNNIVKAVGAAQDLEQNEGLLSIVGGQGLASLSQAELEEFKKVIDSPEYKNYIETNAAALGYETGGAFKAAILDAIAQWDYDTAFGQFSKTINAEIGGVLSAGAEDTEYTVGALENYTEALASNNEALHDNADEWANLEKKKFAAQAAVANAKFIKGVDELSAVLGDNIDVLIEWNEASLDTWEAADKVQTALENVFGVRVSANFIKKNLADIQALAQGSTDNLEALSRAAAEDFALNLDTTSEENRAWFANLLNDFADIAKDIDIGVNVEAKINDKDYINRLNKMLAAGEITAEQVEQAFGTLGYSPDIKFKTVQQKSTTTHTIYDDPEDLSKFRTIVSETSSDVQIPYIAGNGTYQPPNPEAGDSGQENGSGITRVRDLNSIGASTADLKGKDNSKKIEAELDRYHEVNEILDSLDKKYGELEKAKGRAFGQKYIDLISEETSKTLELIKANERLKQESQTYLKTDRAGLKEYGAQFDSNGLISNYEEMQETWAKWYYDNIDKAGLGEKQKQQIEEKWQGFQKATQLYETSLKTFEDADIKLKDLANQLIDLKLEAIQYQVEIRVQLNEDDLKDVEYQLSHLYDPSLQGAQAIGLIGEKMAAVAKNSQEYARGIELIFDSVLNDEQMQQLLNGDFSVLEGVDLNKEQLEALKKYRDSLYEENNNFYSYQQEFFEAIANSLDSWNSSFDTTAEQINNLSTSLETYQNIIDLVGRKNLGISYEYLTKLSKQQVNNSIAATKAAKEQLEFNKEAVNQLEEARDKALSDPNLTENQRTELEHYWNEQIDAAKEKVTELEQEVQSSWTSALEAAAESFSYSTEMAASAFEEAMSGVYGTFETLQSAFSQLSDENERYMQSYQQIYELSKLNRDINNSIDDTDSIKGKAALRELQEEINALQESGTEMTEYDLEYMRKRYELRLAEIALEDAQNAKSQVRMRRDSEGNWGYVYAADQDNIDKTRQDFEDKLYAQQESTQNRINDLQGRIVENEQAMLDDLNALSPELEDYEERRARIIEFYSNKEQYLHEQLSKAISNSSTIYNTDWLNYSQATGYKISSNETWVDSWKETILAQTSGFDTIEDHYDAFKSATEELTSKLSSHYGDWKVSVEEAFKAAGQSIETFGGENGTAEKALNHVSNALDEFTKSLTDEQEGLGAKATKGFNDMVSAANSIYEEYHKVALKYVSENNSIINGLNNILQKQQQVDDIQSGYYGTFTIDGTTYRTEKKYKTQEEAQGVAQTLVDEYKKSAAAYNTAAKQAGESAKYTGLDKITVSTTDGLTGLDYQVGAPKVDTWQPSVQPGPVIEPIKRGDGASTEYDDWKLIGKTSSMGEYYKDKYPDANFYTAGDGKYYNLNELERDKDYIVDSNNDYRINPDAEAVDFGPQFINLNDIPEENKAATYDGYYYKIGNKWYSEKYLNSIGARGKGSVLKIPYNKLKDGRADLPSQPLTSKQFQVVGANSFTRYKTAMLASSYLYGGSPQGYIGQDWKDGLSNGMYTWEKAIDYGGSTYGYLRYGTDGDYVHGGAPNNITVFSDKNIKLKADLFKKSDIEEAIRGGAIIGSFDTGGYTGSWDSSGRLAMLHQKEIVLNAHDTENFLSAINIVRDIASAIDLRAAAQQSALSMMTAASVAPMTQTLEQQVTIHAEFPNATQRTEIEAAFDTLLNRASQFANRKN